MMGDLLQLFAHACDKWVASGRCWAVGGWQAPEISACIWQVSISLYQQQNKGKLSRLNFEN